jgi:hypothetical protein
MSQPVYQAPMREKNSQRDANAYGKSAKSPDYKRRGSGASWKSPNRPMGVPFKKG